MQDDKSPGWSCGPLAEVRPQPGEDIILAGLNAMPCGGGSL